MPFYDVINTETEEVTEFYGSFEKLQDHLKDNPSLRQHFTGNAMTDACNYGNVCTKQQPTDAYKKRLRQIQKFHKMDVSQSMNW